MNRQEAFETVTLHLITIVVVSVCILISFLGFIKYSGVNRYTNIGLAICPERSYNIRQEYKLETESDLLWRLIRPNRRTILLPKQECIIELEVGSEV